MALLPSRNTVTLSSAACPSSWGTCCVRTSPVTMATWRRTDRNTTRWRICWPSLTSRAWWTARWAWGEDGPRVSPGCRLLWIGSIGSLRKLKPLKRRRPSLLSKLLFCFWSSLRFQIWAPSSWRVVFFTPRPPTPLCSRLSPPPPLPPSSSSSFCCCCSF